MKKKIGFFATCLIILAIVPIRIYQYFNNIEISTGFYKQNDYTHLFFAGLIILGAVLSVVLFAQTKKNFTPLIFPKENDRNITMAFLCALMAVGFLIFANTTIISSISSTEKADTLTILLYSIFTIIAVICFIYMAVKLFTGNSLPNPIACILPATIMLIRLVQTYISNFTIKNISEFPLLILMINASLIFYLFFARIISGYKSAKFYSCAAIFSSITSILCFASAGSRFVVQIINYNYITADNQPMYIDLITGIAAITFLGFLAFSKNKKEDNSEEDFSDDGFVKISSLNDIQDTQNI